MALVGPCGALGPVTWCGRKPAEARAMGRSQGTGRAWWKGLTWPLCALGMRAQSSLALALGPRNSGSQLLLWCQERGRKAGGCLG